MHLTKLELQEMLREMGVKFSHTESYENLKKMFQEENHMRWMGKGHFSGQQRKGLEKRVIRKRATTGEPEMVMLSNRAIGDRGASASQSAALSKNIRQMNLREKGRTKTLFSKPEKPETEPSPPKTTAPIFDRSRDVFSTVLRRAQNCCELCGCRSHSDQDHCDFLKPFYIQPVDSGGEISIKNVVALCSECHDRLTTDSQPSDLKQLKRKARDKIIRAIQVERKHRL